MSREYEKAVDTLVKDAKYLRTDVKGVLGALRGKAGDYLDNAKVSAEKCITRRPFVSLLTALGVGVTVGYLLRRRRQKS